MKCIIFWDVYPEKLKEVVRLMKIHHKMWIPPEGLKVIEEFVTPNGKFIQIVESANEAAITKYVYAIGMASGLCKSVKISPVMLLQDWFELF
jgi:hypothetical protein